MTIYRLKYHDEAHPTILIDPEEGWDKLPEDVNAFAYGKQKSSYWQVLDGRYYYNEDNDDAIDTSTPCPDISCMHSNIIAISEAAKEKLGDALEQYGELLPISANGNRHYYFNMFNRTDAIDPFNSKKQSFEGEDMGAEKIAFIEHEVENLGIFRTEYDKLAYNYCTEEFKQLIENSGLTSGWTFHKSLRETAESENDNAVNE